MADLVVLCYHGVSHDWPERTSVSPANLEAHVRLMLARGYRPVTFSELVACPSRAAVAITFDDANATVFELAYQMLANHGAPATVFVPTRYPSTADPMAWQGLDHWIGTQYEDELRCMSWDQLEELAANGWEIGSHTVTHPRLTQLDDVRLLEELRDSRSSCEERLGRRCRAIAYPYSDCDTRVIAAAREANYTIGATVPTRPARRRALTWPRIGVFREDGPDRFRFKVSKGTRLLTPVWRPVLELARSIQLS